MNKADLEKLGLTVEALEKAGLKPEVLADIIVLHGKDIEKFKALQPQLDEVKGQLDAANTTIAELKKVDPVKLQENITDWETKFKTLQTESEQRLSKLQEDHALETVLKEQYKVRDPLEVLPHLKRDQVTYKEGKFTGLDEQVKPLTEKKPYLFNTDDGTTDPSLVVTGAQSTATGSAFDTALLKGAGLDPATKLS